MMYTQGTVYTTYLQHTFSEHEPVLYTHMQYAHVHTHVVTTHVRYAHINGVYMYMVHICTVRSMHTQTHTHTHTHTCTVRTHTHTHTHTRNYTCK